MLYSHKLLGYWYEASRKCLGLFMKGVVSNISESTLLDKVKQPYDITSNSNSTTIPLCFLEIGLNRSK